MYIHKSQYSKRELSFLIYLQERITQNMFVSPKPVNFSHSADELLKPHTHTHTTSVYDVHCPNGTRRCSVSQPATFIPSGDFFQFTSTPRLAMYELNT